MKLAAPTGRPIISALPAAGAAGNLTLGFGYSGADQLTARTVSNGVYG